jgi:hypothetical protein
LMITQMSDKHLPLLHLQGFQMYPPQICPCHCLVPSSSISPTPLPLPSPRCFSAGRNAKRGFICTLEWMRGNSARVEETGIGENAGAIGESLTRSRRAGGLTPEQRTGMTRGGVACERTLGLRG